MSSSESSAYGHAADPLTPHERARLRSSVDTEVLEEFLVASKGASRRAVIAHFAREVLVEDLREIDPELAVDWDPPPAEFLTSDGKRFLPIVSFDTQLHVTDPRLRRLWDRIEPHRDFSGSSSDAG